MPARSNIKKKFRYFFEIAARRKHRAIKPLPSAEVVNESSAADVKEPLFASLDPPCDPQPPRGRHPKTGQYDCEICGKTFPEPEDLTEHHRSTSCGAPIPEDETTLIEEFSQCMDCYKELLDALNRGTCYIAQRKLVDREQITEGYVRLKIWGEQIKIEPSDNDRSLENVPRSHEQPKTHEQFNDVIKTTIRKLRNLLGRVLEAAKMTPQDLENPEQNWIDSTSDDSASTNSQEKKGKARRAPKITIIVRHIFDQIQTLYDTSSVLRRSRLENVQSQSSEKFSPAIVPHSTAHWPTAKALRRKDKIFFSSNQAEFRMIRLQLELLMWATHLQHYQEAKTDDSESLDEHSDELKRAIEKRVIERANNINISSDDDADKRRMLIREARGMIDSLSQKQLSTNTWLITSIFENILPKHDIIILEDVK